MNKIIKNMKIKCLMATAIVGLLAAGCGSKEVRVTALKNDRYIVQNEKTGKLGVQFQTEYMQNAKVKPVEVLPTKYDVIDCALLSYFVQWGDSAAVFTAPEAMAEDAVVAQKIADLNSYDLENKGSYGVPVVLSDGKRGHYFIRKYPKFKEQMKDLYSTDIVVSFLPSNSTREYMIAGPYDNLYNGFTEVQTALGGFTSEGRSCYVVERDGKFSVGNSFGYDLGSIPFATQWFDDLIIVRDGGGFIYLCCKNVSKAGMWDVMYFDGFGDRVRLVEQLTKTFPTTETI